MPLIQGSSRESIGSNIKTEQAAGKPHSQALAIALSQARKARERRALYRGGETAPEPMAMGGEAGCYSEGGEVETQPEHRSHDLSAYVSELVHQGPPEKGLLPALHEDDYRSLAGDHGEHADAIPEGADMMELARRLRERKRRY